MAVISLHIQRLGIANRFIIQSGIRWAVPESMKCVAGQKATARARSRNVRDGLRYAGRKPVSTGQHTGEGTCMRVIPKGRKRTIESETERIGFTEEPIPTVM